MRVFLLLAIAALASCSAQPVILPPPMAATPAQLSSAQQLLEELKLLSRLLRSLLSKIKFLFHLIGQGQLFEYLRFLCLLPLQLMLLSILFRSIAHGPLLQSIPRSLTSAFHWSLPLKQNGCLHQ
jgi:hypothetical protein